MEHHKINTNLKPIQERPDEKFLQYGPEMLTDAELLAIIIRTGSRDENSIELAQRILNGADNTSSILNIVGKSLSDLQNIPGVGKVKSVQIKSIVELSRRISKTTAYKKMNFSSANSIAQYYMEDMRFLKYEAIKIVLLDTKNNFICDKVISKGTVNASIISPREIFMEALNRNAVCIVLLHNHPSGDPQPSKEDLVVTERIKNAGELMGVRLLDHIIIGDKKYISLREQGKI